MVFDTSNSLLLLDCHRVEIFIVQEIRHRGLKVAVVGIPKTIDNDIPVRMIFQLVIEFDYILPGAYVICQRTCVCFLSVINVNHFLLQQVIDKSFGFDTAVEEAQRAINAAHVEATSCENCIGLVKLMGRYSGKLMLDSWAKQ